MNRFGRHATAGFASIAAFCAASPATAQDSEESVLTTGELRSLVAERSTAAAERRSALASFLDHPEVRRIAGRAGIDIRRVRSATATLSDEEVARLEPRLRDAEEALEGGDTLVISSTAIIIGLLIIILLIVA